MTNDTETHDPNEHLLVLTTWPDADGARQIAQKLLDQRLAACINILPAMISMYTWQGRTESGSEHQLFIKTNANRYAALQDAIAAAHPYAVAEIIAVPIVRGLPAYLHWIDDSTS